MCDDWCLRYENPNPRDPRLTISLSEEIDASLYAARDVSVLLNSFDKRNCYALVYAMNEVPSDLVPPEAGLFTVDQPSDRRDFFEIPLTNAANSQAEQTERRFEIAVWVQCDSTGTVMKMFRQQFTRD